MDKETRVRREEDIADAHVAGHGVFAFSKKTILDEKDADHLAVSVYEVPPGKASVPYHYHMRNEELFYILSGTGVLKTPSGEREVTAGDFCYFPNNAKGAHKLTNASATEPLRYIDIAVAHDIEVAFYPESDKVGIFGKGNRVILPLSGQVEYYDGEECQAAD